MRHSRLSCEAEKRSRQKAHFFNCASIEYSKIFGCEKSDHVKIQFFCYSNSSERSANVMYNEKESVVCEPQSANNSIGDKKLY